MKEAEFQNRLSQKLDERLNDSFDVRQEYRLESEEADLKKVHDIAILQEELRMLLELKSDEDQFQRAKHNLRSFYGPQVEESSVDLAACAPTKLVIFNSSQNLVSEDYEKESVEEISEQIKEFLM